MAKILNPESAALQNRIKEAAFRLLHLPDFKYSPESLEQYCTVTDEKIEFSRSNTKEYFKKALIDLRIEGLEEAEEYAAARIVDAIEEETAYNKAVAWGHDQERKERKAMATSSHSQSINGKRARGKLNVTNNYYTGTKEGGSQDSVQRIGDGSGSLGNMERSGGQAGAQGPRSLGTPVKLLPGGASKLPEETDDGDSTLARVKRVKGQVSDENRNMETNSKGREGAQRGLPAMGILADRSPNRIPIGDTQLGVGRKAAGSPTKVAMERMIAARDEERRKDQELRKLVLDVEADGESLRLAQADYDAALSRQKRATDEYEAAHEEKRKRVLGRFAASPSSTAPALSAERPPSAGSTGERLGVLAAFAATQAAPPSPGHFRSASRSVDQAKSEGTGHANAAQVGSAFDPFISHNSVHSLEGLPPRHPRSLNPAAATGRGATSSFVLSGDAANTVAEKAQNAAAQLTPLRNPLKVTVTTSPGAPVYGAESLHGEKAVTDQGGQDDEAKLEARRTEKWSSPRLQTGNEASALGEDAFAASAAKSYGAASAASGLPGKGNNDRPEVGLEEVEDGEIVDMELEGSPGDEKPRVPAAGGDGPAPQTAQVEMAVKDAGLQNSRVDVVMEQQHGAAYVEQLTLDVKKPLPNAQTVVASSAPLPAPQYMDNEKASFALSSANRNTEQINRNGQYQAADGYKTPPISNSAPLSDGAPSDLPVGSQSDYKAAEIAAVDKKVLLTGKVDAGVTSRLTELKNGAAGKEENSGESDEKLPTLDADPKSPTAEEGTSSFMPKDAALQPGEGFQDVGVYLRDEKQKIFNHNDTVYKEPATVKTPQPADPCDLSATMTWDEMFERYFEPSKAAAIPTTLQPPGQHAQQTMEAGGKPTGAQAGRGLGFSTLDPVFRCDDIGSYLDEDELIPGQADQDYPETNAGSQIKALAPSHPLTGSGHLGSYPGAFDRAAMVDRPSQVAISQKGRGVVETVGSGMEKKRVGAAEPKYADTMTAGGSVKEARRGDRAMFWTRYENTEYDRDDHDVY